MVRLPLAALAAVALIAIARAVAVAPTLPDPVGTHFALDGRADGWMSRTAYLVVGGVLLAFLVGLCAGLPLLLRVLPASLIHLPHREHWLAPERRAATVAALTGRMAWFGVGTLAFFAGVLEQVHAANRDPEGARLSGSSWYLLVGYLAFTGLWLAELWRRFRRVSA